MEKCYIIFLAILVGYANGQVMIPCNFNMTQARGYECRLPDVDLSQFDNFTIVGGTHLPGLGDANVESFFSVHNNFREFPTADLARFQFLRHIKVSFWLNYQKGFWCKTANPKKLFWIKFVKFWQIFEETL